jgi:hypothetical protein
MSQATTFVSNGIQTQTITTQTTAANNNILQLPLKKKSKNTKAVQWDNGTIDNEYLNKKKSSSK